MTITYLQNGISAVKPAAPGFGTALRHVRGRSGWTQRQLADAVGLEHSMVSRLEAGSRNPSRETVLAICRVLDVTDLERIWLATLAGYLPGDLTVRDMLELYGTIDDVDDLLAISGQTREAVAS